MATFDKETYKRKRKAKIYFYLISTIIYLLVAPYLSYIFYQLITQIMKLSFINNGFVMDYNIINGYINTYTDLYTRTIFYILIGIYFLTILYTLLQYKPKIAEMKTRFITHNIETPVPAGNGQFGNARFMNQNEKNEILEEVKIPNKLPKDLKDLPKITGKIGVVLDVEEQKEFTVLRYVKGDKHFLGAGITGAGKNRRVIFNTIVLHILAGKSLYVNDIKGENFYFTSRFAKLFNYNVYPIDLRRPEKSIHYNFLQPIINAYNEGDKAKAVDCTWDLVSALVGEQKGEAIWHNGETATIASIILAVVYEAPNEKYKNLTNVYYFLQYMTKPDEEGISLYQTFLEELNDPTHPCNTVFAMAEIAHYKTRSSFFSSALGTLKLFINPNVAEMTSYSDFELENITKEKSIIYMILPDEKKTMYSLVSLFITQLYMAQVEVAVENGGRSPIDFHYTIDEAGNCPMIPVLEPGTTAGRSRGIIFDLYVQSFSQLKKIYDKSYETIKSNCEVKLILKVDDETTIKELVTALDTYTIESPNASVSVSDGKQNGANYSNSSSLMKRNLMEYDEISRIEMPDALCKITGKHPLITNLPDISSSPVNKILGLGDEDHNLELIRNFESERPARPKNIDIPIWKVWESGVYGAMKNLKEEQKNVTPVDFVNPPKKEANRNSFI